MRFLALIIGFCLVIGLCGCQSSCNDRLLEENKTLALEYSNLSKQVEDLTNANQALQRQLLTLSGLDPTARIINIVTVDKIEVAQRTSIYDKDRDGIKESLIVYLKTLDAYGDAIKAAGRVDVELWNLDLLPEQSKVAEWIIKPSELKNKWAGTVMTNYYRLVFDVLPVLDSTKGNLTVKVSFTDYLTGRKFTEQVTINNLLSF
jgi:hypothetical protein